MVVKNTKVAKMVNVPLVSMPKEMSKHGLRVEVSAKMMMVNFKDFSQFSGIFNVGSNIGTYIFFFLIYQGKHLTCKARGTKKGYGNSGTPQDCKFPFKHGNKLYKGCAPSSYGPWCATEVSSNGVLKKWARCNEYCNKDEGNFFKS